MRTARDQIHLSTCVLLMLLVMVLTRLNLDPRGRSFTQGFWLRVASTTAPALQGWPWPCLARQAEVESDSPAEAAAQSETWLVAGLAGDLLVAGFILASAGMLWERRCERGRSPWDSDEVDPLAPISKHVVDPVDEKMRPHTLHLATCFALLLLAVLLSQTNMLPSATPLSEQSGVAAGSVALKWGWPAHYCGMRLSPADADIAEDDASTERWRMDAVLLDLFIANVILTVGGWFCEGAVRKVTVFATHAAEKDRGPSEPRP